MNTYEELAIAYWGPPASVKDCIYFWGHRGNGKNVGKECLSQWYPCEFKDNVGRVFSSAEQFMMAYKAILFKDKTVLDKIMSIDDPKEIKALGRQIQGYSEDKWKQIRLEIVLTGNYLKFSQNPELKKFLLSTGDKYLVEASPHDAIWGIGLDQSSAMRSTPSEWGLNLLGIALMAARQQITG